MKKIVALDPLQTASDLAGSFKTMGYLWYSDAVRLREISLELFVILVRQIADATAYS